MMGVTSIPYTLDELDTTSKIDVYLEYRHPEYNSGYRLTRWVRAWLGSTKSPNRVLYGKTWRCWAKKPSDEETKLARWLPEEDDDA